MLTLFMEWRVSQSHRRGNATVLCALVLGAGLLLAGCANEPVPVPTMTSTETITPSPEPSTTTAEPEPTTTEVDTPEPSPEPTPPDPAQLINENTEDGAKSAAKYFIELHDFTYTSQDPRLLIENSVSDCGFCVSVIENVDMLKSQNSSRLGGELSFSQDVDANEFAANVWEIKGEFQQAKYQIIDNSGKVSSEDSPPSFSGALFVEFENGNWKLIGFGN